MKLRFKIQNRYQDEGWRDTGESFNDSQDAIERAWESCADPIGSGMQRVVDIYSGEILVTYGAGENRPPQKPPLSCVREVA